MSTLPNFADLEPKVQTNPFIKNIYNGGVDVNLNTEIEAGASKGGSNKPQLSAQDKQKIFMYSLLLLGSLAFGLKSILPAKYNPFRKQMTAEQRAQIEDQFAQMQMHVEGTTGQKTGKQSVDSQLRQSIEQAVKGNAAPPPPGTVNNNSKIRPDPGAPSH